MTPGRGVRYPGGVRDQLLTGVEAAECFRECAEMLENLIPLLDCGCPRCVESAGKGFVELGEELTYVATHIHPECVRPHTGGGEPVGPITDLSESTIRRLAGSLRMSAASLERTA